MAVYEIKSDGMHALEQTTFHDARILERQDLQRHLRDQIDIVSPNTLVVAEAFRDWEDSRREIDLLGIDKSGNLVVIELKRTEDAGHAELQAIRYAAMISAMTFEKIVEVFSEYLRQQRSGKNAQAALLEFLELEEPDEDRFAQDVRIVLVAADFSKELMTTVMWLNERELDLRCVRLRPYKDGARVLVDVQQVLPLPEAADYMVRIREKAARERQERAEEGTRKDLRKSFWEGLLERSRAKTKLFGNVSASDDNWILTGSGISNIHYQYLIREHDAEVNFLIERERDRNKRDFDILAARQTEIEASFGAALNWNRSDQTIKSRITGGLPGGGYRSDRGEWPSIQDRMIDAMLRLEKTLSPYLSELRD